MDNFLGELNFATTIDNTNITGISDASHELVSIEKLPDYLTWRQKEFIEKYEGIRYDSENDNYACFESELESGEMLLYVINTQVLEWDKKASHPWDLNISNT